MKKSNPKKARPLSYKHGLHLVLRSTVARGRRSFLQHGQACEKIVQRQSRIFGVRVSDWANVGNHIHMVVRVPSRQAYRGFIRAVTGLIARVAMSSERGKAAELMRRFWDLRPFTRIVCHGRDEKRLGKYIMANRLESVGINKLVAKQLIRNAEVWLEQTTGDPRLKTIG